MEGKLVVLLVSELPVLRAGMCLSACWLCHWVYIATHVCLCDHSAWVIDSYSQKVHIWLKVEPRGGFGLKYSIFLCMNLCPTTRKHIFHSMRNREICSSTQSIAWNICPSTEIMQMQTSKPNAPSFPAVIPAGRWSSHLRTLSETSFRRFWFSIACRGLTSSSFCGSSWVERISGVAKWLSCGPCLPLPSSVCSPNSGAQLFTQLSICTKVLFPELTAQAPPDFNPIKIQRENI